MRSGGASRPATPRVTKARATHFIDRRRSRSKAIARGSRHLKDAVYAQAAVQPQRVRVSVSERSVDSTGALTAVLKSSSWRRAARSMTSQTIDIGTLSLEQLNQLKQQHEQEIQNYKAQHDDIRQLEARFRDSRSALDVIAEDPQAEGRSMLVPLTQSLYVPGEILDAEKVLVDIGTGYFIEQNVADAKKLIDRRAELIAKNSANVTTVSVLFVFGMLQSPCVFFLCRDVGRESKATQSRGHNDDDAIQTPADPGQERSVRPAKCVEEGLPCAATP